MSEYHPFHKPIRRQFLFICLLFLFIGLNAQIDRAVNRIFIWDVTLSMKGFIGSENGKPIFDDEKSIWEEVKGKMIEDLSRIPLQKGTISIIPFQDTTYPPFQTELSESGKKEAIRFIKNFDTEKITNTNICRAWDEAMSYIKEDQINFVFLYTDGQQSKLDFPFDPSCLYRIVNKWCILSEGNEYYSFYISLSDDANLSDEMREKICESCPDHVFCGEGLLNILSITPIKKNLYFNIQDSETTNELSFDISGPLPNAFAFDMDLESNPFGLELSQKSDVEIINNKVQINFKFKSDIEKFVRSAPEELSLDLTLIPHDVENYIIDFTPNTVCLNIINKKEKTLRIHVKDK